MMIGDDILIDDVPPGHTGIAYTGASPRQQLSYVPMVSLSLNPRCAFGVGPSVWHNLPDSLRYQSLSVDISCAI